SPARKNWIAYILVSVLLVHAQVFGGWVLAAQWASILLLPARQRPKNFVRAAVATALLIAPLAYFILIVSDRTQLAWLSRSHWIDLCRLFMDFSGSGGIALLILYAMLAALSLYSCFATARPNHNSPTIWNHEFLLLWFLLPIGMVLLISFWRPMFEPRF